MGKERQMTFLGVEDHELRTGEELREATVVDVLREDT